MNTEQTLIERSGSKCELCASDQELTVFQVAPHSDQNPKPDQSVLLCKTCVNQIENPENIDPNHWRCLGDSMWSQISAVQVMSWRMLTHLAPEGWPQDLLDTLYLEDEVLAWAKSSQIETGDTASAVKHLDSNGTLLKQGDSVTLIKDLNVKGANFTAKRGTMVRSIALVEDNPDHIEGRVNGQHIVILTKFVKKA